MSCEGDEVIGGCFSFHPVTSYEIPFAYLSSSAGAVEIFLQDF